MKLDHPGDGTATRPTAAPPFVQGAVSVGVHCVLQDDDIEPLLRAIASLVRATELALSAGTVTRVHLRLGDVSERPCIDEARLRQEALSFQYALALDYAFFGADVGGHNRLAEGDTSDVLLLLPPGAIVVPQLINTLLDCLRRPGVGMAGARQLPIDYPRDFDPRSGRTDWTSTVGAMVPLSLFRDLGGFDPMLTSPESRDLDYCWRTRLAGFSVMFQPAAQVFHDRLVSREPAQPDSELQAAAESALILAHKWSRPEVVEHYSQICAASQDVALNRALQSFRARDAQGTLPAPLDPEHRAGPFVDPMRLRNEFAR